MGTICIKQPDTLPRLVTTILLVDKAHAWFDGAAQQSGNLCGARGVIKIDGLSKYRWTLNCVRGTNTRAELMGSWATLILSTRLCIHVLHVMGDSKIVIDYLMVKEQ